MRKTSTKSSICKEVPINCIVTDGLQTRAAINSEAVLDYSTALKDGANFPPLAVFTDGIIYWLADGFHRLEALKTNGKNKALCDVRTGTRQDAIKFALGANASHGLRRTNADKRRTVEIALHEFPDVSDNQIACWCAVSHPFVASIRRSVQLVTVTSSPRIGRDGKTRSLPPPRAALGVISDLRERLDQLSPDDRLVVETTAYIFHRDQRSFALSEVFELIDHLQQQARN
jgi:uncharacterized ParB-like nuclease family protein